MKYRTPSFKTMKDHQLNPTQGFSIRCTLISSDNQHITYPADGVITIIEQGTDLCVISASFQCLHGDDTLGPPVLVRNPMFIYDGSK